MPSPEDAPEQILTFSIEEEAQGRLRAFVEAHDQLHGSYHGPLGGRYTFIFQPTNIGTFSAVKCACGVELQLEDGKDF